jgi:hypothetical protein
MLGARVDHRSAERSLGSETAAMHAHEIKLDRQEAEALIEAAALHAAVAMGQLGEIAMLWRLRRDPTAVRQAGASLKAAWRAIGGRPGLEYFRIEDARVPQAAKAAWDVYKLMRHRLAWEDQPEGGVAPCFKPPVATSSSPLPQLSGDAGCGYRLAVDRQQLGACLAALELRERLERLDFEAVLAWLPEPRNAWTATRMLRAAASELAERTAAAPPAALAVTQSLAGALKGLELEAAQGD